MLSTLKESTKYTKELYILLVKCGPIIRYFQSDSDTLICSVILYKS